MPQLDGLAAIERSWPSTPSPFVVMTGQPTARESLLVWEATRRGALEVVEKRAVAGGEEEAAALRAQVRQLARVRVVRHGAPAAGPRLGAARAHAPPRSPSARRPGPRRGGTGAPCVPVAIGASAGGPPALATCSPR
jgi:chemotaxis response regulator CheB